MKRFIKGKKILIIVGLLIVVIGFVIGFMMYKNSYNYKLKKVGYSATEIKIIKEKLNDDEINKVITDVYNKTLTKILEEKYFIPTNLTKYIEYSKNNTELTTDLIITYVNVGSYQDFYTGPKESDLSLGNKMLVNKFYYLTDGYNPEDIVKIPLQYAYEGHSIKEEVYNQFKKMWAAAKSQNLTLIINSSYRTMAEQKKQYDLNNDDFAARPGYSEHQTGLALDVITYGSIGNAFDQTEEFKWLQDNAHQYGFILRYPKDKEKITGYNYESWHYRYLGTELATKVKESGLTYDEYFVYYCEYKKAC